MKRSPCHVAAASLLIGSIASQALAQEGQQTLESAQRFLVENFPASFRWAGDEIVTLTRPVVALDNCTNQFVGHARNGAQPVEFKLEWRYAILIRNNPVNGLVQVTFRGGQHMSFDFAAYTLADRAARAMNFLRSGCDPSAETGF